MKVTVTMEFDSVAEALALTRKLELQPGSGEVTVEIVEPSKKRSRKKAEPATTLEVAPGTKVESNGDGSVTVSAEVTQADAQAAIEKVYGTKGLAKARELLQRHGVERLKDLKPEQYPAFIKAAEGV